ncbi:probable serine/threonine-protein kinase PBL7 [Tanacetum coccineum]|uniref:Probable serine/threonine-protein kinase PBL7 n=1 Tax=Tanacetum coccineum TaxID=301880 RepID=A0ABQ5BCG9_9ASTR
MAYGSTPDAFDEYLQMSEHTARDALFFFNMCIIELYMPKYLRKPTLEDVVKIQQKHNNVHGFPGMLGSIDCMHWEWKNCPVSWQGQYGRGDKKYPTIMLEAVASQDLWIWHAFYGMAGANNDINVLDNSPLFDDLLDDLAPVVPYVVNGVQYRNGVRSARKDVECAFGVLQRTLVYYSNPGRADEVNHYVESWHKWKNPESTLQRRSRLRGTDKEPDHFGDDELPRPPGLQRIAKSQRSGSNSTASSSSNPVAYQEFMAKQYDLDRKAKMQVLSQESEDRRRLIQA